MHKGGARCDGVAIKHLTALFLRDDDALLGILLPQLVLLTLLGVGGAGKGMWEWWGTMCGSGGVGEWWCGGVV